MKQIAHLPPQKQSLLQQLMNQLMGVDGIMAIARSEFLRDELVEEVMCYTANGC